MKLLFDQNLSFRLSSLLQDIFPGSLHVRDIGFAAVPDAAIWNFAKAQGFIIVSKDLDFRQLSFLHGHPPKVVWVSRGECSTGELESLLRGKAADLTRFDADPEAAFFTIR